MALRSTFVKRFFLGGFLRPHADGSSVNHAILSLWKEALLSLEYRDVVVAGQIFPSPEDELRSLGEVEVRKNPHTGAFCAHLYTSYGRPWGARVGGDGLPRETQEIRAFVSRINYNTLHPPEWWPFDMIVLSPERCDWDEGRADRTVRKSVELPPAMAPHDGVSVVLTAVHAPAPLVVPTLPALVKVVDDDLHGLVITRRRRPVRACDD